MITLSEADTKKLERYPKIEISQEQFDNLPEYSTTTPTQSGSIGVKKWKKRTPLQTSVEEAIWFHGEIKDDMIVYHHIIIKDE